jgi:hypothetical protein
MPVTYRASLSVDSKNPYIIRWTSTDKEMGDLVPVLEALFFYDEGSDDEIEIYPADSDLEFEVKPRGDGEYEISFKGSVELELEDDEFDALTEAGFAVDCVIAFEDDDGEMAEPEEDFEIVESPEVLLVMD